MATSNWNTVAADTLSGDGTMSSWSTVSTRTLSETGGDNSWLHRCVRDAYTRLFGPKRENIATGVRATGVPAAITDRDITQTGK